MANVLDNIINMPHEGQIETTAKDFKAPIDVRWCAGCGGYAILSNVQKIMPDLNVPKEKIVFISGIGCSSRFPYYMDVYGMHTLHGRALAIASGVKIARPDLSVWVSTGDGDCMSIGGNHFIHAARRNVDINVIMFNNEVYSLTKGQYSPTSRVGQKTKSSPLGVLDDPFNPVALAIGAGSTLVARAFDRDVKAMKYMFERAKDHKGFAFVEVYANCVIFNDGAFDGFSAKDNRSANSVFLDHGKPLIYDDGRKGIKLDGFTPTIIDIESGEFSVDDALVHDEKDSTLASILANMSYHDTLPHPTGIFQSLDRYSYDEKVVAQIEFESQKPGANDIEALLKGTENWEIK